MDQNPVNPQNGQEVDEFGIPIKKKAAAPEVDEFGIPIKKKEPSAPSLRGPVGLGQGSKQASPPQPPISQQGVPSTSKSTSVSGVGTGSVDGMPFWAKEIKLRQPTFGEIYKEQRDPNVKYKQPTTFLEKVLAPEPGSTINALKALNTYKENIKPDIERAKGVKNLEQQKAFTEKRLNEIANLSEAEIGDPNELRQLETRLSELDERIKFEKMSEEEQLKAKTIPYWVSYMQAGGNRIIDGASKLVKGAGYLMSSDNDIAEAIAWVTMPGAKAAWELFKPENAQPKDNPLYQLGTVIDDWREKHHHLNPLVADKFSYQLTTALTGDLPMYGATAAFGGPAAVSVLGAMDNGVSEYEQAREKTFDANSLDLEGFVQKYGGDNKEAAINTYNSLKGKNPEDVGSKMFLLSAAVGSLEGLPFVNWVNKLDKRTGGFATKYFEKYGISKFTQAMQSNAANPFVQGIEEAAQEMISQGLTNAAANKVYDETRSVLEGLKESGAIGFSMGFLTGGLASVSNALSQRRATATGKELDDIDKSEALVREYERRLLNNEPVASPKTLEQKRKVDEIDNKIAEGKDLNETQISALKEVKKKAEAEYDRMLSEDMDRLGNEGKVIELQQKAEAVKDVAPEEAANFLAEAERIKAETPVVSEAVTPTEAVVTPTEVAPEVITEGAAPSVPSPEAPKVEVKPIINEQAVVANTTKEGLITTENTIGDDVSQLDADPRNSEEFTYIDLKGEKRTGRGHGLAQNAKYRVFKGKSGKKYVQVGMTALDAGGRDGGASVIFEATGDVTPQMEQAIFDLKAENYKDGNVINEKGLNKFKADVAAILKGEAAQVAPISEVTPEAAPSVPSPEAQQAAEVNRQAVRVFEEISPLLDARKGADVKNKRDINKAISEKIKSNPKADFIYTNWNKLKKQLKFEHEGNCP